MVVGEVSDALHYQTKTLIERIGKKDGYKFRDLLYRIILGLNKHNKEFYAEQRRLGPTTEKYSFVKTYRQSINYNPKLSRLWRAAYAYIHLNKFDSKTKCADFFKVNKIDLDDLVNWWSVHNKPKLANRIIDRRQVNQQVIEDRLIIPQELWVRIVRQSKNRIYSQKYKYLIDRGYYDESDLIGNLVQKAICRVMTLDWQTDINAKYRDASKVISNYLCDLAKAATAKKRTRYTRHINENDDNIYSMLVVELDYLDFQDKNSLFNSLVTGDSLTENVISISILERLDVMLSTNEKRVVSVILGDADTEIDALLEGEPIYNWLEWVCDCLDVDYILFCKKIENYLAIH